MTRKTALLMTTASVLLAAAFGNSYLHAATEKTKGYLVAEISVTDPEVYKQYAAGVPPILAKYGGKYLVRGGQTESVEGPTPAGRIVVIEFDSLAAAGTFEHSPEYQALAPLRHKAAQSRIFLVEGVNN
jgi:uncharacterized protein (DUF1330 family)